MECRAQSGAEIRRLGPSTGHNVHYSSKGVCKRGVAIYCEGHGNQIGLKSLARHQTRRLYATLSLAR